MLVSDIALLKLFLLLVVEGEDDDDDDKDLREGTLGIFAVEVSVVMRTSLCESFAVVAAGINDFRIGVDALLSSIFL